MTKKIFMRPLILISNDDGYLAKGINSLVEMVRDFGDVILCAPDGGRSGKSRAFTVEPLTLTKMREEPGLTVYACSGTPVDSLKMAYHRLCPRKPDLILSGINHGDNASTNSHYSGTVGVAIEGAMKGVPSIAFSLCDYSADADFEPMRPLVRQLVEKVLNDGLKHYCCLNVNYPKAEGDVEVRWTRMAYGHWRKEVVDMKIEEATSSLILGKKYYIYGGFYQNDEPEAEDTDAWALAHGYASITPLTVDSTDFDVLNNHF